MPSASLTIRTVLPQDIAAWRALRHMLWRHVSDEHHMLETRRLLVDTRRHVTFIALARDGAPVGFAEAAVRDDYVNGCSTSPILFLEGIYVIPDARRGGIARALCAAVGQWGVTRGCAEFASDTSIDNVDAQALHRALGFEETERVVFFRKRIID